MGGDLEEELLIIHGITCFSVELGGIRNMLSDFLLDRRVKAQHVPIKTDLDKTMLSNFVPFSCVYIRIHEEH